MNDLFSVHPPISPGGTTPEPPITMSEDFKMFFVLIL